MTSPDPLNAFRTTVWRALPGILALTAWVGTATAAPATPVASSDPQAGTAHLFDTLDADKDGTLSRQEFQAGYAGLQRLVVMQVRLRERFDALDADRSGAIEAGEYAQLELIRSQGKSALPLSAFDANHDQKLEFPEYIALVRRLSSVHAPAGK